MTGSDISISTRSGFRCLASATPSMPSFAMSRLYSSSSNCVSRSILRSMSSTIRMVFIGALSGGERDQPPQEGVHFVRQFLPIEILLLHDQRDSFLQPRRFGGTQFLGADD